MQMERGFRLVLYLAVIQRRSGNIRAVYFAPSFECSRALYQMCELGLSHIVL